MTQDNPIYEKNPMQGDSEEERVIVTETVATPVAENRQYGQAQSGQSGQQTSENNGLHWLREEEVDDLQSRWNSIQTRFVDEPRSSVEQADALVEDAMARIAKAFTNKRTLLDQQWMNQSNASTEELRTTLQGYRTFLNRLLEL